MLLTVGELKKYLQDAPDDALFGVMDYTEYVRILAPKRFLLLKPLSGGKDQFVCNCMGTDFNESFGRKNGVEYKGHIDASDYKLKLKSN